MSRVVLIGERRGWRCGIGTWEDVGHRCNDPTISTTGEYAMKRADMVEPILI